MATTRKKGKHAADHLESTLKNLTIDPSASPKPTAKPSKKSKIPVADSWEDEASSSSSEAETPTIHSHSSAPPPTPISPSSPQSKSAIGYQENLLVATLWESSTVTPPRSQPSTPRVSSSISPPRSQISGSSDRDVEQRRPEKTNAVANRMIAGALGIRAPKKTEEQRAYDKAVQESERARRDKEKADARRKVEEMERAKRAIWDA